MNDSIVEMQHVSKAFSGILALDDVHINLRRGEVHALMGENGAGKSTLMKILAGVIQRDTGSVQIRNEQQKMVECEFKTPLQAQKLGISMVFQEFNLLNNMDIAENIFLGREPITKRHCIDRPSMYNAARTELNKVKLAIDPKTRIENMSCGQKQLIEIAKCLSFNARVIILDEPTASLTNKESEILFGIIKNLREQGISIVYISHRMEEVFDLADRITVFRDGKFIRTVERKEFIEKEIVRLMIGRDLEKKTQKENAIVDNSNVALEVRNAQIYKNSHPVNLKLYHKEILGMFGLVGAGRTELSRLIFGIDNLGDGKILINGKEVSIKCPQDAINAGIGLVPEDRKELGLILDMSIKDNMLLPKLGTFPSPILKNSDLSNITGNYINDLNIMLASETQPVKALSGGNQQKVVIAKWMAMNPKILILDEPTRGIDIGAKNEIYQIMRKLTNRGMSIIMISSELAEIQKISDRVIVMHEGDISGELTIEDATSENVMNSAIGITKPN